MNLKPWETYRSGIIRLRSFRQLLVAVPFRCLYHTTLQVQCQYIFPEILFDFVCFE